MLVFEEVRVFASPGPDSHPRSAPQGLPLCGSGLPSFISNQPASPWLFSTFLPAALDAQQVISGAAQFRTPCPALSFRPRHFSLLFLVQYLCALPHRSHPAHHGSEVAALSWPPGPWRSSGTEVGSLTAFPKSTRIYRSC